MARIPMPPGPFVRKIESIHFNPITGALVALCNDKSVWTREGTFATSINKWRRLDAIPPNDLPTTKENENDITTIV